MTTSRSFWETQLANAQASLEAYSAAELALGVEGGVLSYTLDTGQGRQTVTRRNLSEIRTTIDSLMNRIATLEARLNGCGTALGRPGW